MIEQELGDLPANANERSDRRAYPSAGAKKLIADNFRQFPPMSKIFSTELAPSPLSRAARTGTDAGCGGIVVKRHTSR
jgi:hypothetical protein